MTDFERLLRQFPQEVIRTRKGKKNAYYQYIPSSQIIYRLNETTLNWSFSIKDRIVEETEVAVLGSLTIEGIIKEAWGSSYREGKSLGDALKSSASLSLSKCCSLLGMPVIFNTTQQQPQQQKYNNYQQPAAQNIQREQVHACMDCGLVISDAEVQFTRKYPQTYDNKELCRECQQQYRNKSNITRVK